MTVMILFATVEGQTGKIARFVEKEVRRAGQEVVLVDVGEKMASVSYEGIDKVILAAPVHARRHPEPFEVFLVSDRRALANQSTLLISVSLSAAFPEGLEEAGEYLTELKMRTGFTPDAEALVAGAVRTNQYDYFAAQVVRHVVLRGRDFDPSADEHEFTNWQALATKLSEFLAA